MDQVSRAVSSYRIIRDRILALASNDIDETTLADTLEGLSDFNEVAAEVVRSALLDEAMADGLSQYIERLQGRLRRLAERAKARRQIVRDAMVEVDLRKVVAPDLTFSVRPGSPSLVVVDEQVIPEPYWRQQKPRLDRIQLTSDLKRGVAIAGATLSNPEPVLSVRVR